MNKTELKQIEAIISRLDTAVGMLIVESLKDSNIKKAMELVSTSSFLLSEIIAYK